MKLVYSSNIKTVTGEEADNKMCGKYYIRWFPKELIVYIKDQISLSDWKIESWTVKSHDFIHIYIKYIYLHTHKRINVCDSGYCVVTRL